MSSRPSPPPDTLVTPLIIANQPSATSEPPKKKRVVKNLPDGLATLTKRTFRTTLSFRKETDSSETGDVMVAYRATVINDSNITEVFELDKLTIDQLRRFCRNVGVTYVNKRSKFQCRKGLWIRANRQEQMEQMEKDGGNITFADDLDYALMGNTNQPLDGLETWNGEGVGNERSSEAASSPAVVTTAKKDRKAKNKKNDLENEKNDLENEKNDLVNEKKRAYAAVVDISDTVVSIRDQMIETNKIASESNRLASESNRLTKQRLVIMLAQHLNKNDILEELLMDLRSDS
jgi:hypothetical protein